jgi:hypothetical protein
LEKQIYFAEVNTGVLKRGASQKELLWRGKSDGAKARPIVLMAYIFQTKVNIKRLIRFLPTNKL